MPRPNLSCFLCKYFGRFLIAAPLLFLCVGLLTEAADRTQQPGAAGVRVGLHASWADTPPGLEAAAYLLETHSSRTSWAYLDHLAKNALAFTTEEEEYNAARSAASAALNHSKTDIAIVEWALSARIASPRVHSSRKLGENVLGAFGRAGEGIDAFLILTKGGKMELVDDLERAREGLKIRDEATEIIEEDEEIMRLKRTTGDHVSGCNESGGRSCTTVILYADLSSPVGALWHNLVRSVAKKGEVKYVYRYFYKLREGRYPALQGWKAVATLKSTEYIATDDVVFTEQLFSELPFGSSQETPQDNVVKANASLCEKDLSGGSLSQLCARKDLEALVAQHILQTPPEEALERLQRISETFQVLGGAIRVGEQEGRNNSEFRAIARALENLRTPRDLPEGVFINGQFFGESDIATHLSSSLHCISAILRTPGYHHIPEKASVRFSIPSHVITWLNDIENEDRYASLKKLDSAEGLKMLKKLLSSPEGAGRLALIRSNYVQLVLVLNLGVVSNLQLLEVAHGIALSGLPIRVGVVAIGKSETSLLMAAGFLYLVHVEKDMQKALFFLQQVKQVAQYFGIRKEKTLPMELAEMVFAELFESGYTDLKRLSGHKHVSKHLAVLKEWGLLSELVQDSSDFSKSLLVLNGEVLDGVEMILASALEHQKQLGERLLREAAPPEEGVALEFWRTDVIEPDSDSSWISTVNYEWQSVRAGVRYEQQDAQPVQDDVAECNLRSEIRNGSTLVCSAPHLDFRGMSFPARVFTNSRSATLTTDEVETESRRLNAHSKCVKTELYNKDIALKVGHIVHSTTVWLVGEPTQPGYEQAVEFMERILIKRRRPFFFVRFAKISSSSPLGQSCWQKLTSANYLREAPSVFVINGRCVPVQKIDVLSKLEFLVVSEARKTRVEQSDVTIDELHDRVLDAVLFNKHAELACARTSDIYRAKRHPSAQQILSHLGVLRDVEERRKGEKVAHRTLGHPLFLEFGNSTTAPVRVLAILSPVGRNAQAISTFLRALNECLGKNAFITVVLVPARNPAVLCEELFAMFQKFVLAVRPRFDKDGSRLSPAAFMQNLPRDKLLTFAVDTPRAWFVTPHSTNYDLDNILLSRIPVRTVHAEYELRSLLVEGSAVDINTEEPTQGLQLELSGHKLIFSNTTMRKPRLVEYTASDTIVMANLGYWQLRAEPGPWKLRLSSGRSRTVYSFAGAHGLRENVERNFQMDSLSIDLKSLDGLRGVPLALKRKSGMEDVPLLGPETSDSQVDETDDKGEKGVRFASSLKRFFGSFYANRVSGGNRARSEFISKDGAKGDDVLHVFTVVSGHLYERFLKIMMLSVTNRSSMPVKFWLLENYLSPNFRKILPRFSVRHGFSYSLITYKWPSFLREQRSKQRIIWAYKILFLDVLFPLDLDRVIFVDADQVANKDPSVLMSMDLRGAPYGYPPFCNSREDMKGYRFWETGFWKDTLKGASYKISALYVVDLKRFRETSAGDTLRALYQSLSADPNSLSNLDQDLPNYASAEDRGGVPLVKIFELPGNFLWCESWCHASEKSSAVMWDLCNNPMTKEPKLTSARRIIPGWDDLDRIGTESTNMIHEEIIAACRKKAANDSDDRKGSETRLKNEL